MSYSHKTSKYYKSHKSSFARKIIIINLEEKDNIIEIDSPLILTPEKYAAKRKKIQKQEIIILDSDEERDIEGSTVQRQQPKEKEVGMIFKNPPEEEIESEKTSVEETPIKRKNPSNLLNRMTNLMSFKEKLQVEREKSRSMMDKIYLNILSSNKKEQGINKS